MDADSAGIQGFHKQEARSAPGERLRRGYDLSRLGGHARCSRRTLPSSTCCWRWIGSTSSISETGRPRVAASHKVRMFTAMPGSRAGIRAWIPITAAQRASMRCWIRVRTPSRADRGHPARGQSAASRSASRRIPREAAAGLCSSAAPVRIKGQPSGWPFALGATFTSGRFPPESAGFRLAITGALRRRRPRGWVGLRDDGILCRAATGLDQTFVPLASAFMERRRSGARCNGAKAAGWARR